MGCVEFTKERLNRLLMALLGSDELVEKWWLSPNRAFGYVTPEVAWDIDSRRVTNYILEQFQH